MAESTSGKIRPLSSSNYESWKTEMSAHLCSKGLYRLVSGQELRPDSDLDKQAAWDAREKKAAGEIGLYLESDQRVHVKGIEHDPVAMWAKLEAVHVQKIPGSRFNAYDDFFSIRKRPDESLSALIARIEHALGRIKDLRPANFSLDKLDNELVCMAMIRSLPSEYSSFTSSLLLLGSLDKDTLKEAFITEEVNRT